MAASGLFQERPPSFAKSYDVNAKGSIQTVALRCAPETVPGPPSGFVQCWEAPKGVSVTECGQQARGLIDRQLKHGGALLLQSLPIVDNQAEAEKFVEALGYRQLKYEPFGFMRRKVGKLDAATNVPAANILPVHNEMSYNVHASKKVLLLCLRAAKRGGENLLASNAEMTSYIPPEILWKFDDKGGIRYTRQYIQEGGPLQQCKDAVTQSDFISWKTRTGADTIEEAAQYWRDLGFTEVSHDAEGTLTVANTQPACIAGPSGAPLFFNFASKAGSALPDNVPFHITYGDGEAIEQETVEALVKAEWRASCAVPVPSGSMLVLDNFQWSCHCEHSQQIEIRCFGRAAGCFSVAFNTQARYSGAFAAPVAIGQHEYCN
ncbi:hypothetical protein WJX73_001882 [Symbiochloris irregularis]|uniref:TauD/TfdA-like domain-containing protein n=1 Tax=Symbiochloris irregularis TaxID=706552 RepID=A0AAW1NTP6_9CHLO